MAQFPGVQWNLRPDYVALTQRVDPAGIVTAYNPPRPGVSATDVTSFVFGQANITINDWPEIMYYLNPTREWHAFRSTPQPPQKLDAQGQPMFERQPRQGEPARPLLDFPILPDTISSQEELWWIDLWRRMDPRIHWEDILMRIELPNRTVEIERHLQNSTNNLINRHEHRLYFMLAWHSTNANGGVRPNEVRSYVLRRVAAAQTPLPPNSTRGITPGMINPALGNVPGNVIPQPVRRINQGRFRVAGRAAPAQAGAPAPANAALPNIAQAYPLPTPQSRDNQGRSNHGHDKQVGNKRRRKTQVSSSESEDDITSFGSDESNDSDDTPPRLVKARAQSAPAQKAPARKGKDNAGKRKVKSKSFGKTKKVKRSVIHQRRNSTSEAERENDADASDMADSSIPRIYQEGDPGFEEAFQASRRRRQAQQSGRSPRRRHRSSSSRRTSPNSSLPRRGPLGPMVSDSELLGEMEDDTQNTVTNPQVSALRSNPTNLPAPLSRQNRRRSAITGQPFTGRHHNRRGSNPNPYRNIQPRRRASTNRDSPVAQPTHLRVTEDITGRAIVAESSSAALLELPVERPDRPAQSVYALAPDGAHHHYTDETGTASFTTYPEPSSNSRMGFTPGQRAFRQPHTNPRRTNPNPASNARPHTPPSPIPDPASDAQRVGLPSPIREIHHTTDTNKSRQADRTSGHAHALPTHRARPRTSYRPPNRLASEIRRHNNALDEEQRRREQWSADEMGRHANAVRRILGGGDDGWTRGFLEREHERERREVEGSSDEE